MDHTIHPRVQLGSSQSPLGHFVTYNFGVFSPFLQRSKFNLNKTYTKTEITPTSSNSSFSIWSTLYNGIQSIFDSKLFKFRAKKSLLNSWCLVSHSFSAFKGQLISKSPFWCHKIYQKIKEIFVRISALATNKRSNQKSSLRESK